MNSSFNGTHQKHEGKQDQEKSNEKSKKKNLLSVNNNKKKREDFKYGNYQNYYNKRLGLGQQQTDLRLEMLAAHPEYFRNKSVLDIGCNSGFITINFAKQLLPAAILGIDIDGGLIDKARHELEKEKTEGILTNEEKEALSHVFFRNVSLIHLIS